MLESIQGEGGIRVAKNEFLQGIEKLCKDKNLLFLLDEVQAGIGRTGNFLGYQESGISPDAVAIAKGLGGGFPIGAIWLSEKWENVFKPGSHGTTFGGSPLACSAANAVLDVIEQEDLIIKTREKSAFLIEEFNRLQKKYSELITEVRGRGLMLALVINEDTQELIKTLRQKGLLVVGAAGNAIRFLPPLTVKKDELIEAIKITESVLEILQKEKTK
jgi:acetylornithine aminotransferase/acetylornithine/N-succinyldiaminopimelate aminotransferase